MVDTHLVLGATVALPKTELDHLIQLLKQMGYTTVGPTVREDAIVYSPINGMDDLPKGYLSEQDSGHYRLLYTGHPFYFAVTPGPHTWKQFIFPRRKELFTLKKNDGKWQIAQENGETPRYAFIGVRPCELFAIQIQDRVFLREDLNDPIYRRLRQRVFLLNVNCRNPGGTCFCASMGTGPKASTGFDLSMTELEDVFVVEVASELGRSVMTNLSWEPASAFLLNAAQKAIEEATHNMGREIPNIEELPTLLLNNLEHSHWDDVAKRCLGCTNCTQVCPTCFCWDVQDQSDLLDTYWRRERVWDSCFNPDYSYTFGGNTRPSIRSRYRQWLTHKLGSWQQQFGTLGCVGCGRCITWCPAAIDITAEVAAIREEMI